MNKFRSAETIRGLNSACGKIGVTSKHTFIFKIQTREKQFLTYLIFSDCTNCCGFQVFRFI